MVLLALRITAELENLTELQPKTAATIPNSPISSSCDARAVGSTNLIQKCKFCGREGTITMVPGRGRPLTQELSEAGKSTPVTVFECRGYEPVDYGFGGWWKARSLAGTTFDNVDLSEDEFSEYDEKGECPVMISKPSSSFVVQKN
ncbi:hypothetical protein ACLB2K_017535 [Fragaria x ananassa]